MFKKKAVHKAVISAITALNSPVGQVQPERAVSSESEVQSKYIPNTFSSIPLAAVNFNDLPDCAYVRQPVVLSLFGFSKATLWRHVKCSRIPSPVKLGLRISAWNVGQLRECLNNFQATEQTEANEGGN